MATRSLTMSPVPETVFPAAEVESRLLKQLKSIAEESSVLRPEWEPLLDSKRVVGTVLALEDLFPFKLPPDKIVRKGGYDSVEEASKDMLDRIKKLWTQRRHGVRK